MKRIICILLAAFLCGCADENPDTTETSPTTTSAITSASSNSSTTAPTSTTPTTTTEPINYKFTITLEDVDVSEYETERLYDSDSNEKFDTLDELVEAADLVFVGSFRNNTKQHYYKFNREDVVSENELYVSFDKIFKGGEPLHSENIVISQNYGVYDDEKKIITYSELTPMNKGDEWLFFLTYDDISGTYRCTGDYQGRYPIPTDKIKKSVESGNPSAADFGVYESGIINTAVYKEIINEYFEKSGTDSYPEIPDDWIELYSVEELPEKFSEIINSDSSDGEISEIMRNLVNKNILFVSAVQFGSGDLISVDRNSPTEADGFGYEIYPVVSDYFTDLKTVEKLAYGAYLDFVADASLDGALPEKGPLFAEIDGKLYFNISNTGSLPYCPFLRETYIDITEVTDNTCTFGLYYKNPNVETSNDCYFCGVTCTANLSDGKWLLRNKITGSSYDLIYR